MNNEDSKNLLVVLGIPVFLTLVFIAFIPLGLFNAFVVQKLYGWFLLPLGLPALNLLHIWGISILINHYVVQIDGKKPKKGETMRSLANSIVASLLALLVGFVIKGLM